MNDTQFKEIERRLHVYDAIAADKAKVAYENGKYFASVLADKIHDIDLKMEIDWIVSQIAQLENYEFRCMEQRNALGVTGKSESNSELITHLRSESIQARQYIQRLKDSEQLLQAKIMEYRSLSQAEPKPIVPLDGEDRLEPSEGNLGLDTQEAEKILDAVQLALTPVVNFLLNHGLATVDNVGRRMRAAIVRSTGGDQMKLKAILGLRRDEIIRWGEANIVSAVRSMADEESSPQILNLGAHSEMHDQEFQGRSPIYQDTGLLKFKSQCEDLHLQKRKTIPRQILYEIMCTIEEFTGTIDEFTSNCGAYVKGREYASRLGYSRKGSARNPK